VKQKPEDAWYDNGVYVIVMSGIFVLLLTRQRGDLPGHGPSCRIKETNI